MQPTHVVVDGIDGAVFCRGADGEFFTEQTGRDLVDAANRERRPETPVCGVYVLIPVLATPHVLAAALNGALGDRLPAAIDTLEAQWAAESRALDAPLPPAGKIAPGGDRPELGNTAGAAPPLLLERAALCDTPGVTLDGEPAVITGARNPHAMVRTLRPGGPAAEFAWPTVARITAAGTAFRSY
jgi:hypothetical protein